MHRIATQMWYELTDNDFATYILDNSLFPFPSPFNQYVQARNQDFMWGVLTRPKWTKLPKCIFYCPIRLYRKVAIHEKL